MWPEEPKKRYTEISTYILQDPWYFFQGSAAVLRTSLYINIYRWYIYIYILHIHLTYIYNIYIYIVGTRARARTETWTGPRDPGRDPGQRGGTRADGVGPGPVRTYSGPGPGASEGTNSKGNTIGV